MATHTKLTVRIKGNANAEKFIRDAKILEGRNGVQGGTKYQIRGSVFKVMIYGEFDDATYERILCGKKDLSK